MSRPKNPAKPTDQGRKYNSGVYYNGDRVDCSDLEVIPFVPLDCAKREFAHLKSTGPGYVSLASGQSLVEVREDD